MDIDKKVFIIAEAGVNHNGNIKNAIEMISVAKESGVDAIKFQTHIAHAESTLDEQWRVNFSYQDNTRYNYWERMSFTQEQWKGLAQHATDKGLEFMSSPFSIEAVEMLTNIGVKCWKVASGEIYNPELLEAIWKTKLPVLYSSGMSTMRELDRVINQTKLLGIPYGVFQCSSIYPTPPEFWGLKTITKLREKYRCPVGLSDHSGGAYATYASIALGAQMIELHAVFSRYAFGPDVKSSVTIEELKAIVDGARMIKFSLESGLEKDDIATHTSSLKVNFGRSLALNKSLIAGTQLKKEDLTLKKPGSGIAYKYIDRVIGKKLLCDVNSNRLIKWEDFN